jgi:hypothetical protein
MQRLLAAVCPRESAECRERDEETGIARTFKPRQTEEAAYLLEMRVGVGETVYASRKWNGWSGLVEINQQGVASLYTRKSMKLVFEFEATPYFHEWASLLRAVFVCEIVAVHGEAAELGHCGVPITIPLVQSFARHPALGLGLQVKIICLYEIGGALFTQFSHSVVRAMALFLVKGDNPEVEVIPEQAFTAIRAQGGGRGFVDERGAQFLDTEALLRHLRDASDRERSEGWVLWTEHNTRPGERPFEMDSFGTPRYSFCVKWKRVISVCAVCVRCHLRKGDGDESALVLFALQGGELFKCGVVDTTRCAPYIRAMLHALKPFNPMMRTTTTLEALTRAERSLEEVLAHGCALDVTAAWASRAGSLQGVKYIQTARSPARPWHLTDLTKRCKAYPHWEAVHRACAAAKAATEQLPRAPKRARSVEAAPAAPAPAEPTKPAEPAKPAPTGMESEVDRTLERLIFFLAGGDAEHRKACREGVRAAHGTVAGKLDAQTNFIVIPYGRSASEFNWMTATQAPNASLIVRSRIMATRSQLAHRKFFLSGKWSNEFRMHSATIEAKHGVTTSAPDKDTHFIVIAPGDAAERHAHLLQLCAPGARIIRPSMLADVIEALSTTVFTPPRI